jgi:hypothetical protein
VAGAPVDRKRAYTGANWAAARMQNASFR